MRITRRTVLPTVLVLAGGLLVSASIAAGSGSPQATLVPSAFNHPMANAYFPLTPGLVLRYRGTDGGQSFRERVTVTHQTKLVNGITARVLDDVLRRSDGSIAEKTSDWYADDNLGNVWYLGENTATYDKTGHRKSTEGSWEAGIKGAAAGLIMPAAPKPTDAYRQEYWRGQAEDQGWIVQVNGTTHTSLRTFHNVVRSYEWSRLEKHNVSVKLYARGYGIVSEHDVAGGSETFKLVGVTRP